MVSSFEIASWDDSHASSDVFRICSVCSANQSDCSRLVDWTTALLPVNSRREVLCQCIEAVTELKRRSPCVSFKSELHVRMAVGTSTSQRTVCANTPHRQSMSYSTSRAGAKAHPTETSSVLATNASASGSAVPSRGQVSRFQAYMNEVYLLQKQVGEQVATWHLLVNVTRLSG